MIDNIEQFSSERKKWYEELEKKHFSTNKWKIAKSQWDFKYGDAVGRKIFRHHMIEIVNLLSYLYEKYDEDSENDAVKDYFTTAWKYYIAINEAQNRFVDIKKARIELKIDDLKKKIEYPKVYRQKFVVRYYA